MLFVSLMLKVTIEKINQFTKSYNISQNQNCIKNQTKNILIQFFCVCEYSSVYITQYCTLQFYHLLLIQEHLQSGVHFKFSLKHLHLLHLCLQLHFISSLQAFLASGSVVHSGCHILFYFAIPIEHGCEICLINCAPNVSTLMYSSELCCIRADYVVGMLSKTFPCVKSSTLASLTSVRLLVLSYKRTTSLSKSD